MREVVVPPEKRVLNVEVLPSQQEYKPGQKATVKVKLTDFFGKPFVGSTVLSDLRQERGVHLRRLERAGDQGVLLEVAAAPLSADRVEPRPVVRQPAAAAARSACRNLGVFGERVVEELAKDGKERRQAEGRRRCQRRRPWTPPARPAAAAPAGAARTARTLAEAARQEQAPRGERTETASRPAARPTPAGVAADRPQELRRHRLLGGVADDRQGRRRRGLADHARKPHRLEGQGLGDGPRHQGRPGRGRGHHQEGPARPPAGAALLRAEGRSRPVGQRPQLPQDRQERASVAWNWTAAPWLPTGEPEPAGHASRPAARSASIGASRSSAKARPSSA